MLKLQFVINGLQFKHANLLREDQSKMGVMMHQPITALEVISPSLKKKTHLDFLVHS